MSNKVNKLLDFIQDIQKKRSFYNIPKNEILYFLNNWIELCHMHKIRDFLFIFLNNYNNCDYYGYNSKLEDEYRDIISMLVNKNIDPLYYWLKPISEMINDIKNKNTNELPDFTN